MLSYYRSSVYLNADMATICLFFFFNDTATTEIYTLSLHDALPISLSGPGVQRRPRRLSRQGRGGRLLRGLCPSDQGRSEEHTSELQSQSNLVCRLLLEKKKDDIFVVYQQVITNTSASVLISHT